MTGQEGQDMNYRIRHSSTVHDRKGQYRKGQDRKEG
jgi:hypothetical protein